MTAHAPVQQRLRVALAVSFVLLAVPLLELVAHRSEFPVVLGRYTKGYFVFLLAYAGVVVCAALATWLGFRAGAAQAARVVAQMDRFRAVRPLRIALILAPWLALGAAIDVLQPYALGRSAVVQLPLTALAAWSNCLLLVAGRKPGAARAAIARLVLVLIGAAIGLGTLEAFLRRFPQYIPDAARPRLAGGGMFLRTDLVFDRPIQVGFHYLPNQDLTHVYRRSDGDLYRRQAGSLPLPDRKDETVLARIHFVTDDNGYPNPTPLRERYDIVAAGDSFTTPAVVAAPWPRVVERLTGRSVLNLGVAGYGPQQEVAAVTNYGLPRHPSWVVLAYFEGNDLIVEAPAYESKRRTHLSWIEEDLATAGPYQRSAALQSLRSAFDVLSRPPAGPPRFPLELSLGGRSVAVAFYDVYESALTAARADIEGSINFEYVRGALLALQRAAATAGARFLLLYVPSKEHLYSSLITDPGALRRALAGVHSVVLKPDRFLGAAPTAATPEQVWAHRDDQRDAIVHLAHEHGIDVLDLTPDFLAAAASGTELYYFADTHWNQAGHDLAARLLAAHLAAIDGARADAIAQQP